MTFWTKFWKRFRFQDKAAILPAPRLLFLVFLGLMSTAIGAWWGWSWLFFSLANGTVLGLVAIDAWFLRKYPRISAERRLETLFELGKDHSVTIRIISSRPLFLRMWIRDDYPHGFRVDRRTMRLRWNGETEKAVSYSARPHRRGNHSFRDIHLRLESPLGLLLLQLAISVGDTVKVYPLLEPVRRVRKGFYRKQPFTTGHPAPKAFGVGREFSHLREYQPDDDPRQINWMVTARQGKLVSNVHQPETGQEVAILLDCGRMMGVENSGRSQLDHSLEAALGFAAIALQRGDRVSFLAFSDQILAWVPPAKGMDHLKRIIEASYDLSPEYAEADFLKAWDAIARHHRSNTLITLFTDASSVAYSETLPTMMVQAGRKHLVLTVTLQDPRLFGLLKQIPGREEDVFRHLVTEQLLEERLKAFRRFRHRQTAFLDVEPDRLADRVIDSYLTIRLRAGL
jgi:uncharacterized protein (DUF58 family)